ncbi:MAG TPA: hypothetical protein VK841_19555 [Polyangiaceae bacterium]|jgi:hypothetical protein|nr:hypothetical protein [Polyangiaceae bacterium]
MNARFSIAVFSIATFWTASAAATPTFPGDVVAQLGLPMVTIDPPLGCKLCHANEIGGDPLTVFGGLLKSFGAMAYNDASLRAALANVQSNYPQLVTDIQQSIDPNTDPTIGSRPTPEYGCAAIAPLPAEESLAVPGTALGLALMLASRRRRLKA